jgi:hypothetical protein
VHGSVDHDRAVVYGSTVDHRRRWPKGSPELVLGAAPVTGRSPAVGEKEKEAPGVPTVGEGGRCGVGGRPAIEGNGTQRRCLVLGGSGHGYAELDGAKCCG